MSFKPRLFKKQGHVKQQIEKSDPHELESDLVSTSIGNIYPISLYMIKGYHFTKYNIHDEKDQCLAADLNVFDQNLGLNVALVYASNAPCLECLLAWVYNLDYL